MNSRIKKYADEKDLKSLKYIFVDALDVDPTFSNYEEDYNYCKSIPGLLENHVELTPFLDDKNLWNDDYWVKLKMDLLKNFSDKRMTHMRQVAKVYLADKVEVLLANRKQPIHKQEKLVEKEILSKPNTNIVQTIRVKEGSMGEKALRQEEEVRNIKRQINEHNKKVNLNKEKPKVQQNYQSQPRNKKSKKAKGIALVVTIVAVALILLKMITK